MGDSAPDVSVVVPTYNRAAVLPRTLKTALAQEEVDFEVVIVDDHSSDDTWTYLQRLDDPRVRPFRNGRNEGVSRTRNRGIEEARGEWIAFLDDDDLWAPAKLTDQLERGRLERAEFVYGPHVVLDEDLRAVGIEEPARPRELRRLMLNYNAIGTPSIVMATRALIDRVGGFDERLSYLADWELWIRFAGAGRPAYTPELLMGYVLHADSMLLQDRYDVYEELAYLSEKHPDLDVDGVTWTRWLASAPRRSGSRFRAARTFLRGAIEHRNAGNLARAAGILLGERAMRVGRALKPPEPHQPGWLKTYRDRAP